MFKASGLLLFHGSFDLHVTVNITLYVADRIIFLDKQIKRHDNVIEYSKKLTFNIPPDDKAISKYELKPMKNLIRSLFLKASAILHQMSLKDVVDIMNLGVL